MGTASNFGEGKTYEERKKNLMAKLMNKATQKNILNNISPDNLSNKQRDLLIYLIAEKLNII